MTTNMFEHFHLNTIQFDSIRLHLIQSNFEVYDDSHKSCYVDWAAAAARVYFQYSSNSKYNKIRYGYVHLMQCHV